MKITYCLLPVALGSVSFDFRIENSAHGSQVSKESANSAEKAVIGNKFSVKAAVGQEAVLTPSYNFYYGNIYVGTPPQRAEVLLDTGSPVSWVFGPNGSYNDAPMFYYNESSTFDWQNESFSARYGSGQYLGHWARDYVSTDISVATQGVNGTTALNGTSGIYNGTSPRIKFELGVVSSFAAAAGSPGLLGLSPHIKGAGPSSYNTFPEALAMQNITKTPAFSVILDEDTGKFIFGGIDLSQAELPFYRFQGEVNNSNYAGTWTVRANSLQLDHADNYTWQGPVTLDTGSPVTLVPQGFVRRVATKLNLTKNEKYEAYYTESDPKQFNGSITFNLGHLALDIPLSELFVPGPYVWLKEGPQNVSALSLIPSPNYMLGDSFFRHVYTVFDASSSSVYLGHRRAASNSTKIVDAVNITALDGNIKQETLTSTVSETVEATPIIQNRYLGTVSSDNKEASMSATLTSSSSYSSAGASNTTGQSSSNSASRNLISGLLAALTLIV